VPVVVTGFEPVDLLRGILDCVRQLEAGSPAVTNEYTRSVRSEGNRAAQRIVDEVYEVCDRPWRGLGVVKSGGLRLREKWAAFDAERRFPISMVMTSPPTDCRSGDVLSGRIKPTECPHFGNPCTPENPLGAPMVSSEGACAAYFRYRHAAALQPEASRR
jgi:hydrogenase expression/formation protein HypD